MMILLFDCMAHADAVVGDACKKHPQPLAQDMNSVSSSFILQFPPVHSALVNTAFKPNSLLLHGYKRKSTEFINR
jgi:hypothetical protein